MNEKNSEISLTDIFKHIISLKKIILIIVITSVFGISSYITESKKTDTYSSLAYIQIGDSADVNSSSRLVESPGSLQGDLHFKIQYTNIFSPPGATSFNQVSPDTIEISINSYSPEENKKYINMVIDYIFSRHARITSKFTNREIVRQNFEFDIISREIIFKENIVESLGVLQNKTNTYATLSFLSNINSEINNLMIQRQNLQANLGKYLDKNSPYSSRLVGDLVNLTIKHNSRTSILKSTIGGFMLSLLFVFIFAIYGAYRESQIK